MTGKLKTYDSREFAALLGVGPRIFVRMLQAGELPKPMNYSAAEGQSRYFRWTQGQVDDFMGGNRPVPAPTAPAAAPKVKTKPKKADAEGSARKLVEGLATASEFEDVTEIYIKHRDGTLERLIKA